MTLEFDDIRTFDNDIWQDLSGEQERIYLWLFDECSYVVENPVALRVSESGGHYVIDKDGIVHYIRSGWNVLSWIPRQDSKYHVSF